MREGVGETAEVDRMRGSILCRFENVRDVSFDGVKLK